jgi:hypothetical protein
MWQIFPTTVSPSISVWVQRGKAQRLLESATTTSWSEGWAQLDHGGESRKICLLKVTK